MEEGRERDVREGRKDCTMQQAALPYIYTI